MNELLKAANYAEDWLQMVFKASGALNPPIAIKSRVKDEGSIQNKIRRKKTTKPRYSIENVTDILGFRIITLFNKDAINIVEELIRIISEGGPLSACELIELIQYRAQGQLVAQTDGSPPADPIESRLREMNSILTLGIEPRFETRPYYSSIHLILKCPVDNNGSRIWVPAEIQIRSVFEDAYLEIDHGLFFEVDRDNGFSEAERNRVKQEIRLLRSMLDNASDLAEMIRDRRNEAPVEPGANVKQNLDDSEWIKGLLEQIPSNVYSDVIQTFSILLQEKARYDKNSDMISRNYEDIARKFEDVERLFNILLTKNPPNDQERLSLTPLAYIIYQEGALCRLLTGDYEQAVLAQKAYDKLNGIGEGPDEGDESESSKFDFDRYPTAWFRSAQACFQQMELCNDAELRLKLAEDADFRYSEASKRFQQLKTSRTLSKEISGTQRRYLKANLQRLHSFLFWRLSDMRRRPTEHENLDPTQEDHDLILKAWTTISSDATEAWSKSIDTLVDTNYKNEMQIFNAALFYIFDGMFISYQLKLPTGNLPNVKKFREIVKLFGDCLERIEDPPDRYRHTLMNCLAFLGDREEAKRQARKIVDRFFGNEQVANLSPYDLQDAKRIAKEANLLERDQDQFKDTDPLPS